MVSGVVTKEWGDIDGAGEQCESCLCAGWFTNELGSDSHSLFG